MNRYDIYYSTGLHFIFFGKLGMYIACFLKRHTRCTIFMLEDFEHSIP